MILNNVTKLRFKCFKIKLILLMKLHYFATSYVQEFKYFVRFREICVIITNLPPLFKKSDYVFFQTFQFMEMSCLPLNWFCFATVLPNSTHTTYSWNIMCQKWEGNCGLWVLNEIVKKCILKIWKKSWEPFGSCLLNSTANPAQFEWKWAGLAVLFSR